MPVGEYKIKDNTRTVISVNRKGKETNANTVIMAEMWAQ